MTKTEAIINHIRDNYQDCALTGKRCWLIAHEMECAISTVYRTLKRLNELGLLNGHKEFTPKQFLRKDELLPYFVDGWLMLKEGRAQEIARERLATPAAVIDGLLWMERGGEIELMGTYYGCLYRLKDRKH